MADEVVNKIAVDIFVTAKGVGVFPANHLYSRVRKPEGIGDYVRNVERIGAQNRQWHRTAGAKIDAVRIAAGFDVNSDLLHGVYFNRHGLGWGTA